MSRKVAREELFKIVFENELLEDGLKSRFENYLTRDEKLTDEQDLNFIENYLLALESNSGEILETLRRNISGWNVERVGNIERALLKIATYEILFEDVPTEIIINEAVELAKKYGDDKSYEFINGVLAKIVTEKIG